MDFLNVDHPAINTISLCSGVGMLDEGFHAGLGFMGIRSRTVLYAEREAYPVAVLEARMEEGSIHPAPIWFGDFTELPAGQFRGVVDCVVAGFPCQDLSVAGKRAGLDGKRSGLFFEVVRIATDSGAWLMFLENVAGIASATASVVDEAEGELEERAAARVVGELADFGWNAEWMHLSASDVGANHGRERWFCVAWRMANSEFSSSIERSVIEMQRRRTRKAEQIGVECCYMGNSASIPLGDTRLQYKQLQQWTNGAEHQGASIQLADSCCSTIRRHSGTTSGAQRAHEGWATEKHHGTECICGDVADSSIEGLERRELGGACDGGRGGQEAHGPISQFCGLFAPGPSDPSWSDIIRDFPELAPALEPTFRKLVNGLAFNMDDCRAQRLKCGGNGVVPLQAAIAIVVLARRAGIFERRADMINEKQIARMA